MPSLALRTKDELLYKARAERERRRRQQTTVVGLAHLKDYQHDPIGFGEAILGETFTDEIKDVFQSVLDNPVTVAQSANAVGKTHCAARTAIWFYKVFPDAQVFCTAASPLRNLRQLLWGEISAAVTKAPGLFAADRVSHLQIAEHTPPGIEPQTFISGVTIPTSGSQEQREAKFSGKHAPHLLFIVDEGDAVPESVYKGIESCMSGGFARLLIMHNPRIQQGPVYIKARDGQANVVKISALSHPNVLSGEDLIPGAVTRETTVRRINQWTRPLVEGEKVTADCFEVPDFLVGCVAQSQSGQMYPPLMAGQREVKDNAFWYMVLGEYPAEGENQLISRDAISRARTRWDAYVAQFGREPPIGVKPVSGLDVAEFGKDLNCLCHRYGGWVAPLDKWQGLDTDATAIKTAGIVVDADSHRLLVDGTGIGSGVAPRVKRLGFDEAHSVKVAEKPTRETELGEFYQLRDQLWWEVREWLQKDPGAMLPPDERLVDGLAAPTYHIDKRTGKVKVTDKETLKEILKFSPDEADALCMTFAPTGRQWRDIEFLSVPGPLEGEHA